MMSRTNSGLNSSCGWIQFLVQSEFVGNQTQVNSSYNLYTFTPVYDTDGTAFFNSSFPDTSDCYEMAIPNQFEAVIPSDFSVFLFNPYYESQDGCPYQSELVQVPFDH